ncbi:Ribose import permease protein RbsC [Rubrobacter xylanophilus DSM 9941]|uniref:ABC transporter permease n=1 Tax=Rubrobacter xylanophilus TaxID=49319 RepID=UPI001C64427E|nr:ABC transporter permease [Rubrobacter xylanophilus]QYJ16631.1 Ribose import permease protein RbsC [Rubrobacter xylanophilus DSM 9941]
MTRAAQALPPGSRLREAALRQSYVFALVLLVAAAAANYALQPNFFNPAVLGGNLMTYLPLMLLAAGQTVVVIGGGIDLSLGAILSLSNVLIVSTLGESPDASRILLAVAAGLLAGTLAGAVNGACVAYLRFQPIVTTFATSFVFSGLALYVMPSPGGSVPQGLLSAYQADPLGLPMVFWAAVLVLLAWGLLRSTRYGVYLYATGGDQLSAFVSGVPVSPVRLASYCIAGFMAALAGLAMTLSTSTGDPLIGEPLTLSSIVAVVIGGTRLSSGQGGVFGTILGVIVLGLFQSIVSFMGVPSWWQTLINGLIVVVALAGPGLLGLLRQGRRP